MTSTTTKFGVRPGELFQVGFAGLASNPIPLLFYGAVTLLTFTAFFVPSQILEDDGNTAGFIAVQLAGLWVAAIVAYPWYWHALATVRGEKRPLLEPFKHPWRFKAQAAASFWFWAGAMLGARYLLGIPTILVILFYAFYGFIIADASGEDKKSRSGLVALGTSVRMGEKRRIALFAIGALFFVFNMFGAVLGFFGLGLAASVAMAIAGLTVTTSVTMVAGAKLYDVLYPLMPEPVAPPPRKKKNKKKKKERRR